MARNPKAEVEISAHSRTLGAKLRQARAKFGAFGAELRKKVFGKDLIEKGFFSKAGASMVGNIGANLAGAAGGFLAQQGRDVFDFNDQLKRLQITANKTPEEMADFAKSVRKASDDTGIGASKILAGAQAYVALTGDMDGAAASAQQWARVAQATNSSVEDIAGTAAALKQNMNIKPGEMEATFSALAVQGKAGAIELKDLAAQMSTIAPQWAMFKGGTGVQGVKELGAALQIAKRGFGGDAGETVTGVQSLLTALVKNAGNFKKAKIKLFDKDPTTGAKTMRNVFDIVRDIGESKLMKDPTKLEKAFGRVEAYRAFIQLQQNRAELDGLVSKAGDAGAIQRDLDTYLQSSAGRVKVAWQKAKNEIAEAFTPERIEKFAALAATLAKSLAASAGAVAFVLGGVEKFGTGVAKLIGGESEDDRISKLRHARMNERKDILRKQILSENPKLAGADMRDHIESMVSRRMGEEDSMRDAIGRGERLTDLNTPNVSIPRLSRDKAGGFHVNSQEIAGTGRSAKKADGYNVQELVALKRILGGGSDDAQTQKLLDLAITKTVVKQTEELGKTIASLINNKPTDVKVDGKTIVQAGKRSAAHARRPGG